MAEPARDFRTYSAWRWTLEPGDDLVNDFLLPALERARRYDRQAGFFSSSSLLVSARGVEHLLRKVPRSEWPAYRLVVCERLSEDDVEAIAAGEQMRRLEERLTPAMLRALEEPADAAARDRLALLAAMVAVGFAEIRVAVPCTPDRRVKPGAIEHAKAAILHDWAGNTLVAFGSANESWDGWVHNNEQMHLYASWEPLIWERFGRPTAERFERLWLGEDPAALTVDLPRAVRERLVSFAPDRLPAELQPPEPAGSEPVLTADQEAVVLQFLRDAPRLPGGGELGMATAAVEPWPHHVGIVRAALAEFPPRFLLCDEVGLGKTAEAAFILRQLWLEGRVRRALILAPRNLCDQWQDELVTKFGLTVAIYDGSELIHPDPGDGRGRAHLPTDRRTVFAGKDRLLIASSELVRRADRQGDLLGAPPWDLVVLDEAHHARREGFDRDDRGPNQLLRLLQQLARPDRARGVLLLTATPMQIDPREVWDLLRCVGLMGEFGRSYASFQAFYRGLAQLAEGRTDRPLLDLLYAAVRGASADDKLLAELEGRAPALYRQCQAARETSVLRESLARQADERRQLVREFFLAHAPTRQRLFRTTRERLRAYHAEGRIRENVPEREVKDERIPLTPEEQSVYHQVERYLGRHYRNANAGGQRGLGFVLTCYRRRLTSSPWALRRSLERLRERLGSPSLRAQELLDEDDLVGQVDPEETEQDAGSLVLPESLRDLDQLLRAVSSLPRDSKLERLNAILGELSAAYQRVIVFTQYKDTMDYLRRELLAWTERIGCYSGRGAEVYDRAAGRFVPVSKAELQERFRDDDGLRLLVCTEAAAEGLNLQAAGALVNYDMPWNPMRVEQRIGRVDRIGQVHPVVRIYNFYSTPSVEDDVYHALEQRIDLFQSFVGPLQPILATVERTIRRLAMSEPDEREAMREGVMAELEGQLDELEREAPGAPVAEGFARPVVPGVVERSPATLPELERFWLRSPTLLDQGMLRRVDENVYEVRWGGCLYRITFAPEVAESATAGARLLTYGHPVFDALLERGTNDPRVLARWDLRRSVAPDGGVAYWKGTRPVANLTDLLAAMGMSW